MVRDVIR